MAIEIVQSRPTIEWENVGYHGSSVKGNEQALRMLPFTHLSKMQDSAIERMITPIEADLRNFDKLDHAVTVQGGSEIFQPTFDASGSPTWRAKLYLLGEFPQYGVQNPNPWNGLGQNETIAFARITSSFRDPEKIHAALTPQGNEYYLQEQDYARFQTDSIAQGVVAEVWSRVGKFRERRDRLRGVTTSEVDERVVFSDVA